MKRFLSMILVVIISFAVPNIGTAVLGAANLKGDLNSDGIVDVKDLLLLRRYFVGYKDNIDLDAADYNNDSTVGALDILCLRKKLAGLEDLENNIPVSYNNAFTSDVQINQIGYETNSEKCAKLTEDSGVLKANSQITNARCYVVKESDNSVVYSALSTKRKYDDITDKNVSTFDFSAVKTPGTYKVFAPFGYSYTFEIKDNPYKDVQQALITALYYNRCGVALDKSVVGEHFEHDVCHSGDTPVYILNKLDTDENSATYGKYIQSGTAKASDFCYGLHDAGDYGRYTTPANQVVADLLMTYEMYGDSADCKVIPNSNSDLLEEAKHEMKWLLKMQNKVSGGVYWRIATKEFVSYGDRPDQDKYFNNSGLYVSHETLKSTAGFAGAAAMCARVFATLDPDFATECLAAAKSAYTYVKANQENAKAHIGFANETEYPVINSGSYGDNSKAWGDIWWAACELFRTTGEQTYNEDVISLYNRKINGEIGFTLTEISAYNIGGAGSFAYLMANGANSEVKQAVLATLTTSADNNLKISNNDRYNNVIEMSTQYGWGSNQIVCVKLKTMAIVDFVNQTHNYEKAIRNAVCYILGRNAVNKSYITGFGSDTPKDICHAPSAYLRVKYGLYTPAVGFMVGGSYNNGHFYEDNHDNYACNEVCVYWNSSAILAFGYIVNLDGEN